MPDLAPPAEPSARALTRRAGVLDLHVDFILQQRLFGYDPLRAHAAGLPRQPLFWHCDVPRMLEAGYSGACLGIHAWNFEYEGAWRECQRQLAVWERLCEDPRLLKVAHPGDFARARASGRLGLAIAVEGAHMLHGRLERIAELAARGVAYLTLVHLRRNRSATPGFGIGADDTSGLTPFGREVVEELQRQGIVVDLAHVNRAGILDAAAISRAPLVASHAVARGRYDSARGLHDPSVDAIAATGGLIGVMFAPQFLVGRLRADSSCVADHIEHLAARVGVAHVAIGTDFDGWIGSIPSDQRDCRDLFRVVVELQRRGWSEPDLCALLSGNAERVFAAAWRPGSGAAPGGAGLPR